MESNVIYIENTKTIKDRSNYNFLQIIEFKGVKVPICYKLTQLLQVSVMTCESEETGSKASIAKKKQELGKDAAKSGLLKIDEVDKCFGSAAIFLCNEK